MAIARPGGRHERRHGGVSYRDLASGGFGLVLLPSGSAEATSDYPQLAFLEMSSPWAVTWWAGPASQRPWRFSQPLSERRSRTTSGNCCLMTSQPLRVLFLTPYFRPYLGGIERAIEQLSFQIQKSRDVEAVGVLTTKYSFPRTPEPDWADRETTVEGIAIYRLTGYPRRSIPLYSVPLVWFSPLRVRRYLQEFNPNVVHFVGDGWFWGHFWTWFWFRRRARFVFTPSFHTLPLSRWWLRPINGFLCNVVDRVIALTQLESGRVRRAYWVPKRKQGVIGWGAALPKSDAGRGDLPQAATGTRGGALRTPDHHQRLQLGRLGPGGGPVKAGGQKPSPLRGGGGRLGKEVR